MQIAFDHADTPAQALAQGPTRMVLFQHRGGERADWDDPKVGKEGTHPVVYPAAGSHATFYGPAVYVEHGANGSGVGCDNTTAPFRRLRPTPVLLPDEPNPRGPLAWLLFGGYWGGLHGGISGNGPQGPLLKEQWVVPFAWMDAQRRTSPVLPATSIAGPDVTHAFCGAVARVSSYLNLRTRSRFAGWAVLAILVIALAVAVRLTRWRPVAARELRRRRALGQLLGAAGALYARHLVPLLMIGLASLPLLVVLEALDWVGRRVLGQHPPAPGSAGAQLPLSDPVLTYGRPFVFALAGAVVIAFLRGLDRDGRLHAGAAFRLTGARLWRLVGCHVLRAATLSLLTVTVVGIPIAARKFVDWQFVQQAIVFEDASIVGALRRSTELVKGRWWRTLRVAGFFFGVSIVLGPALSFALIFANLSLPVINVIGSVLYAVITPYVTVGRTLFFLDLETHPAPAGTRSFALPAWLDRRRANAQPG